MTTHPRFEDWLRRYGAAWTAGDPLSAVALFTEAAIYRETPFGPPLIGREAIRDYWTEGAQNSQRDVTFAFSVIGIQDDTGWANWQATFTRLPRGSKVQLDGVLAARFATDGRCTEFREWWHRQETS